MSSVAQNRIEFISVTRSDTWIAAQTGIPRSTVGFVRRGERDLPSKYQTTLRNAFQREAYARMRETGFSTTQARRYSWYSTEQISYRISEMRLLVDRFTAGAVGMSIAKARAAGQSYDEDVLWASMRSLIIEGLQYSPEPVEEFAEPDY